MDSANYYGAREGNATQFSFVSKNFPSFFTQMHFHNVRIINGKLRSISDLMTVSSTTAHVHGLKRKLVIKPLKSLA